MLTQHCNFLLCSTLLFARVDPTQTRVGSCFIFHKTMHFFFIKKKIIEFNLTKKQNFTVHFDRCIRVESVSLKSVLQYFPVRELFLSAGALYLCCNSFMCSLTDWNRKKRDVGVCVCEWRMQAFLCNKREAKPFNKSNRQRYNWNPAWISTTEDYSKYYEMILNLMLQYTEKGYTKKKKKEGWNIS